MGRDVICFVCSRKVCDKWGFGKIVSSIFISSNIQTIKYDGIW